MERIESLDWLRGLLAIGIMIFHFSTWLFVPDGASHGTGFIGRLGVYPVSMFFVISGLSIAMVYHDNLHDTGGVKRYFIKRVFRIWPLLWVATILTLIPQVVGVNTTPWWYLFLNLTTLFGFVAPDRAIATGAWSIGNEEVFYALAPLVFLLYNQKKWLGDAFTVASIVAGIVFAMFGWMYVHPLNNLFFYCLGIAVYYHLRDVQVPRWLATSLLVASLGAFVLVPFHGTSKALITGVGRLVLSILSVLIVVSVYKLNVKLPKLVSAPLGVFGMATYSVYLLHPLVYSYVAYFFTPTALSLTGKAWLFAGAIVATILTAILMYHFFEKPFIRLGKRLAEKSR